MEQWAIARFHEEHRFLSNFYPSPIKIGGLVYPTVEHAYQAGKSKDTLDHEAIANMEYPGAAKRYGATLYIREDWDEIKLHLMTKLVNLKFRDNNLRRMLNMTKGSPLIEGNDWHDLYWGRCYCDKHKLTGSNHLGEILMNERDNSE